MEESAPLIAPGIRRLTVNLDSDDLDLFEGLWPVPQGIALHCYLVQGSRTVLIDPWDAGGYGAEELAVDLEALGLSWKDVDAVAFTKAPTGDLAERLQNHRPGLEVWGTPEGSARHDLGAGMALEARGGFWVHTPSGATFTGDHFAGLGWVEEEVWTEDLGEHEARYFEDEALRWYAARPLPVPELPSGAPVAPAHGCLWRSASGALARAQRFADWAEDGLDEVTVVWPAGPSADAGADALVGGALDVGVGLNLYRVPGDDATALAAGARRAALVVVAAGLADGFLQGLDKAVWRPTDLAPDELRRGVVERWRALSDQP